MAGFAAFGAHDGSVFAGVLLYRFVTCWGLIPLGWLAFVLDRAKARGYLVHGRPSR